MATSAAIKELKDATSFLAKVQENDEVIVTRNGLAAFAALSMQQLEALKMEAARAELYRLMDDAEADRGAGRVVDAQESQRKARARYGL